jgi:hypothetical protein
MPLAPSPPADTLSQEVALLDEARGSMAANPGAALSLLDRHRGAFPHGRLEMERELLVVDALGRLGRIDEARARAGTLATQVQGTIYEPRVGALLRRLAPP